MKLVWLKYSNGLAMRVVPRAELTPEEVTAGKGKLAIDLSRSKNGQCIFPLEGLALHDHHSPGWAGDGAAPMNSSNPDTTVQKYMDRIKADIEGAGLTVETEVKEMVVAPPPSSPYDSPGDTDWEKYGVDKPEDEGEEKPE